MTICDCQPVKLDKLMDNTECNCGTLVCKNCGQDLNPEEWILIEDFNAINLPGIADELGRSLTDSELTEFGKNLAKFIDSANPSQSELDEHVYWLVQELKEFGE